jgi:hypothetical protein
MIRSRWWLTLLLLIPLGLALSMGRKEAPERERHASDSVRVGGIHGRVEIWEGNFMPPVDASGRNNSIKPGLGLLVRAYEPVKIGGGIASARRDSVPAPVVAQTTTDSTGRFFLPVPPGNYSVFVQQDSGWYYNGWNGEGIQGAVTVPPDSSGYLLIKVTTKAVF